MESFLTWWMFHNAQIIQWLIAIIVLLSVLWIGVSFFSKSSGASVDHSGLKDQLSSFESNIKNLIDESKKSISTAVSSAADAVSTAGDSSAGASMAAGGGGAELEALKTEFTTLKGQLQVKQEELEKLKASTSAAASSGAAANPEHLARIKVLEAKLAEYEIIEDDIADLSFYKDENKKLKAKLAEMGVAVEANVEENLTEPLSPTAPVEQSLQELGLQDEPAAPKKTEATQNVAAEPPVEAAPPQAEGGDLFSEFSADLNEDIVKQFSESVTPKSQAADAPSEEDLNLDAMLADMEKLEAFTGADTTSALEENTDIDKMASEAENFESKKS